MPEFKLPEFDLPEFKLPEIDLPEVDLEGVTGVAKDAFYITVGAGVLAFQRLQVSRQDLQKQVKPRLDEAKDQFGKLGDSVEDRIRLVEERLDEVETRVDKLLDQLEANLPEQAAEVVKQFREAAKDARGQVRGLVNRATDAA